MKKPFTIMVVDMSDEQCYVVHVVGKDRDEAFDKVEDVLWPNNPSPPAWLDVAIIEGHRQPVGGRSEVKRETGIQVLPDPYAEALFDVLDGNHEWYEIQENTGLPVDRCSEISEMWKQVAGERDKR